MPIDLSQFFISRETNVRDTLACINANARGIALVVNADRQLSGTVTDGDIRRAVLAGVSLDDPVGQVLARRSPTSGPEPITAPAGQPHAELLHLMNAHGVRQIPLLDAAGRVVDLVLAEELMREYEPPLRAVVMAGGFGKRLMPLTDSVPKPMLHVGDKPILERIVTQLQQSGIRRVNLTTHYRPEVIRDHFGDGEKFGLAIDYLSEEEPRGTAGALSMLEASDEPILVVNGDLLTRVDFRAMHAFHREHQADLTVAVRQYDMKVPYGVVQCDGAVVRCVEEKPVYKVLVNAGIYLLEPSAHRSIPHTAERFDMTDLIQKLTREGRNVIAFPIVEYWMDIGHHDDYAQAQQDVKTWEGES